MPEPVSYTHLDVYKRQVYNSPAPNGGVEISTLGADGTVGGTGEDADIHNQP